MAAASSQQDNSSLIDQGIPQWKRELILRRRALARTLPAGNTSVKLTCPSVVAAVRQAEQQGASAAENVSGKQQRCISSGIASNKGLLDQAQADFHPRGRISDSSSPSTVTAAVVGNMRLVEHHVEAGTGLMINGVSVDTNSVPIDRDSLKYRSKMGEEKSFKKSCASSRTIMDNSVVMSENNNCNHPHEDDCQSDSSEELQYGPGIVNKLRSRYLSMTLRENQNKGVRPSLANMRRAASLENLLDSDDLMTGKPPIKSQCRFTKKADAGYSAGKTTHASNHQQRYRGISRGNDSMKRARSVETLYRYESRTTVYKSASRDVNKNNAPIIKPLVNDEIVIVENKPKLEVKKSVAEDRISIIQPKMRTSSVASDTELPPPDLVKQTLKIFESSSSQKAPPVSSKSGVSGAKTTNKSPSASLGKLNPASASSNFNNAKPILSPKPSPEKIRRNANKPLSAKKVPPVPSSPEITSNRLFSVDSNSPPSSPTSIGNIGFRKLKSPSPTSEVRKGLFAHRDSSDSEHSSLSPVPHATPVINGRISTPNFPSDEEASTDEEVLDGATKSVASSALENIRKDGTSMQFSFNTNGNVSNQKLKSYLPGVKSVTTKSPPPPPPAAVELPAVVKPTSIVSALPVLKSPDSPQSQGKQIGIIRPIVTKVSPPPSISLTDREIEKNLINREKSIEQPLNKASVKNSIDSAVIETDISKMRVDDSVKNVLPSSLRAKDKDSKSPGLWDKKPWNQPQNTMVFDFSGRKDPPPDYIENDGLNLRRKTKPKPGESGIILLGSSADESSTDFDPEDLGPPSPCNVLFEGDNILINGRSNLRKEPRQLKLSIKFDDAATTTYEYPSEASLLNEAGGSDTSSSTIPKTPNVGSLPLPPPPSGPTPGLPVPLGGSSLASYTPSKVHLGGEGFQLGVTRSTPSPAPAPAPSQDADSAKTSSNIAEEDYLKPAEDSETVAWSAETAADLLF